MGQVSVTLHDRIYRLVCDDGEEDRLVELATYVKSKVDHLTREIGYVGDERLMLMAALMIADELWDARSASASSGAELARSIVPPATARPDATEPEPVRRLKSLAAKMAAESSGPPVESTPKEPGGAPASPAKNRRRDVA